MEDNHNLLAPVSPELGTAQPQLVLMFFIVLQLPLKNLIYCSIFQVNCGKMGDFKASVVAYEVQKSFANKFFSNKTVAKSLIDDTSGNLLDNLYLLLYVFVSSNR